MLKLVLFSFNNFGSIFATILGSAYNVLIDCYILGFQY